MRSALAALEPELREKFGDAAVARLAELGARLPVFSVFGFECRLARPRSDIDLSVYVPRTSIRWPSELVADPRWAQVLRMSDTASLGAWVGSVRGAWLELDACGETFPLPSIFLHVEGPRPTPAMLLSLIARVGVAEPPDAATLSRCLAALPEAGPVHLQIGAMIPREARNARVVLHGVSAEDALALAADLGWRDETGVFAQTVATMSGFFDRLSIALELGKKVGSRLAIEGQITDQRSSRWREVMAWLVGERLADERWGDVLLGWPAIGRWETRPAGWPPRAARDDGQDGGSASVVRRISHAKVSIGEAGQREAKIYLLVEHRMLSALWPGRQRSGVSRSPSRNP